MTETTPSKEARFKAISQHVLQVLATRGMDSLRISNVAEKEGISRAWIYKYVAKDAEGLADFALLDFAKQFESLGEQAFHGVDPKDKKTFTKVLTENTHLMIQFSRTYPILSKLIFRYSGTQNKIGRQIDETIHLHLQKMTRLLEETFGQPKKRAESISRSIFAIRMGLIFQYGTETAPAISLGELSENLALIFNRFLLSMDLEVPS